VICLSGCVGESRWSREPFLRVLQKRDLLQACRSLERLPPDQRPSLLEIRQETERVIELYWQEIEAVAAALLKAGRLSFAEVREVVRIEQARTWLSPYQPPA
jgi:hypothetical protein